MVTLREEVGKFAPFTFCRNCGRCVQGYLAYFYNGVCEWCGSDDIERLAARAVHTYKLGFKHWWSPLRWNLTSSAWEVFGETGQRSWQSPTAKVDVIEIALDIR